MIKRILLAEDNVDTLLNLHKLLDKAGYTVNCLTEGTSIVENNNQWPDLFIFDKNIPTIDGVALCKYLKLKEETKNIPVIIISGDHKLKKKAKLAGANEFIKKPLDIKKLLKVIEKYQTPSA